MEQFYSAYHWACKAKASAEGAQSSKEQSSIFKDDCQEYAKKAENAALSVNNGYNLFDVKRVNHILNDIKWLKSNNFSWHYGSLYERAYNELSSEYSQGIDKKIYYKANADIIGNLCNNRGVLSGFMDKVSYANIDLKNPTQSCEIVIKAFQKAWTTTMNPIEASVQYKGIIWTLPASTNSKVYISGNGTSWNIASAYVTNITMPIGQWFWLKMTWDGTVYRFFISTDNENWSEGNPLTSSVAPYLINQGLGGGSWEGYSWANGSIDLNESYVIVDGETIWRGCDYFYYKQTPKGYKITNDEEKVQSLFNRNNLTPYYIIDTENERFKLPRTYERKIVKKLYSNKIYCDIYDDGWVEQYGTIFTNKTTSKFTITLPVQYVDADYTLLVSQQSTNDDYFQYVPEKLMGSFTVQGQNDSSTFNWRTCGYGLVDDEIDVLNEYYYIGNYDTNSLEQTASLNVKLFDNKADKDLGNVDLSKRFKIVTKLPNEPLNNVFYFVVGEI